MLRNGFKSLILHWVATRHYRLFRPTRGLNGLVNCSPRSSTVCCISLLFRSPPQTAELLTGLPVSSVISGEVRCLNGCVREIGVEPPSPKGHLPPGKGRLGMRSFE